MKATVLSLSQTVILRFANSSGVAWSLAILINFSSSLGPGCQVFVSIWSTTQTHAHALGTRLVYRLPKIIFNLEAILSTFQWILPRNITASSLGIFSFFSLYNLFSKHNVKISAKGHVVMQQQQHNGETIDNKVEETLCKKYTAFKYRVSL